MGDEELEKQQWPKWRRDRGNQEGRRRRPWQSKAVLAGIVISFIGMALWAYATATRPQAAGTGSSGESRMVTGMTGESSAQPAAPKSRLVDAAGPAVSKFGASFLGGFGLGFASRKFLRWTLLLAAVVGGALFFAQRAGVIDLSPSAIERHVQDGVNYAKSGADQAKKFLTGYIPSATACAVGAFMGFRHG